MSNKKNQPLPQGAKLNEFEKQDLTAENLKYVLSLYPLVKLRVLSNIFKFESFVEFTKTIKSDSKLALIMDSRLNDMYGTSGGWFDNNKLDPGEEHMNNPIPIPWQDILEVAQTNQKINKEIFDKWFPEVNWNSVKANANKSCPELLEYIETRYTIIKEKQGKPTPKKVNVTKEPKESKEPKKPTRDSSRIIDQCMEHYNLSEFDVIEMIVLHKQRG